MKKSKIILGCIISVMTFALTLLFGLPNKVYASEVDDYINDNYSNLVVSNNLYGGSQNIQGQLWSRNIESITNTINNLSTGFYSLSLDITCISKLSDKNDIDNCFSFIDLVDLTNNDEIIAVSSVETQNEIGLTLNYQITFTIDENFDYMFKVWGCGNHSVGSIWVVALNNIMLNKGSQPLPYEPYITGSMIYNQGFQQGLLENATSVLYKAFNGATVNLIYNDNIVISDFIYLTENDLYLSINDMTNIMIYLNADKSSRKYSLSIKLNSAINNELVVLLNNSILDTSLTLSNSLGGYQESFSRAESSLNTIIANSNGKYFDTIIYNPLYPPDYVNFKLNLDLSQLSFQEGYNSGLEAGKTDGYNEGSQDGYYKGYEAGKTDGYNEGFNVGSVSSVETNGIKTLFNSILSYPVNLISNVLDFEFMGVNIASLIMFIVSIGIVVFVVKKFW